MPDWPLATGNWHLRVDWRDPGPSRYHPRLTSNAEETLSKMDERIVVAERRDVFGEAGEGFHGYRPLEDGAARRALRGLCRRTALARRGDVEEDDSRLQPIPYVVLERRGAGGGREVFAYERLPGGGEARLHGRISIGVGGHMNRCFDELSLDAVVLEEAARELEEELHFRDGAGRAVAPPAPRLVGLINDDTGPVQRVHIGLLALVDLPPGVEVHVRETDQLDGRWLEPAALLAEPLVGRLESWGRFALEGIGVGA